MSSHKINLDTMFKKHINIYIYVKLHRIDTRQLIYIYLQTKAAQNVEHPCLTESL